LNAERINWCIFFQNPCPRRPFGLVSEALRLLQCWRLISIEASFGRIRANGKPEEYRYRDPPQMGERRVLVTREAALPFVATGYHVPNLADPDGYVLEVVASLLSAGKSSRFYEKLVRGEGVAIDAGADYSLLALDPPLFYEYAEPLPGANPARVEDRFHAAAVLASRGLVGAFT
jgi:predicted Zn-dependent peptidase